MKKVTKQQKGWIGVVAVLVAVILALGITLGVATKWGKDVENLKPGQDDSALAGGMEVEEAGVEDVNGISLSQFIDIPRAQYAAAGISPIAETAKSVTVVIGGENTEDLKVDWTLSWKDGTSGKWGNGKTVTEYVTGSASSDTHTYNLSCLKEFGEVIVLKAALHDFPEKTATRNIQYKQNYGGNITATYTVTNSGDAGKNLSWDLSGSGTSVGVPFPGKVNTAAEFKSVYGATGTAVGTLTVTPALSSTYTLPADVTTVKAEIAATTEYIGAVTGAGGTLSTAAGTFVTLGSGSGKGAAIAVKAASMLMLTTIDSADFAELKNGVKELGTKTSLKLKLTVNVNGKERSKTYEIHFDGSSFGAIPSDLTWQGDVNDDIIFGGD